MNFFFSFFFFLPNLSKGVTNLARKCRKFEVESLRISRYNTWTDDTAMETIEIGEDSGCNG